MKQNEHVRRKTPKEPFFLHTCDDAQISRRLIVENNFQTVVVDMLQAQG
jgi:hypothetical protein